MEAKQTKTTRRERFLRYAPLLIWTALILTLSTGAGAINRTSLIVGPLLNYLFPSASAETLLFYHSIVRKGAHLFEYAVLALLALWAFRPSRVQLLSKRPFAAAVFFVAIIAMIDEFQQSFDPTRTGSVYDVGLDIVGGLIAVAAVGLWRRRNA